MSESELLARADNAIIALLTPEELEEFAEVEQIEKESEATIAGLLEKVPAPMNCRNHFIGVGLTKISSSG